MGGGVPEASILSVPSLLSDSVRLSVLVATLLPCESLLVRVDVITSVAPLHDAVETTSSSPLLPGSLLVVGLPPRSNVHVYGVGGEPKPRLIRSDVASCRAENSAPNAGASTFVLLTRTTVLFDRL